MDIGTIGGLLFAVVIVALGMIIGGGLAPFFDMPSLVMVFGGTAGAVIASFPLARVLKLHSVMLKAVFTKPANPMQTIEELVKYAEIARREGILSLENIISEMKDPFIVRGVKMAVDGTDPELIKTIMDTELEAMMDRHARAKQMIDAIGRLAPAYGMIGTLVGLVLMLKNMDDPSAIGPGMAVALITTLYGAMIANMVTGPVGDKLASRDAEEVMIKTIVITGVMSIQSGDNPRVVESKLMTFLPPAVREKAEAEKEKKAA